MNYANALQALAVIAATVTATVAIVRRLVDPGGGLPTSTWPICALVIGVGYCLGWQLNLASSFAALVPALAGHTSRLDGVSGQVLTGLASGAVSGFLHDLFDTIRSVGSKA
jgi:hypothetical protein